MSNSNLKQHERITYSAGMHSYDIWKILNGLLYQAAAPLAAYSTMSIETALSCLSLSTDNRRRIVDDDSNVFLIDLFYETACKTFESNEESRLALLSYMLERGVERNIIVDHIAYSMTLGKIPEAIDRQKLRRFVNKYLHDYDVFKEDIVYRYYHFTKSYANKNFYNKNATGLRTTKDDMFHVYIISAMRAIDRFIPFEGTITEYITQWFQNAKGSSDYMHYDNEALSVNRTVRRSIQKGEKVIHTKAIPIEDRENTLTDEFFTEERLNSSYSDFTRCVASLPDSTIMFLALNLPYHLDNSQIARIIKAKND